jgi:hypothetical protein
VTLFPKPSLEEALNQSFGLIVHQVVTGDGLVLICKHISLGPLGIDTFENFYTNPAIGGFLKLSNWVAGMKQVCT